MREAKFTPGPWRQDGLVIKTSRGVIADCLVPQEGGTFDCQDNARLIAAAPELLEAAKAAAEFHSGTDSPLGEQLRAAIAKAEGGAS